MPDILIVVRGPARSSPGPLPFARVTDASGIALSSPAQRGYHLRSQDFHRAASGASPMRLFRLVVLCLGLALSTAAARAEDPPPFLLRWGTTGSGNGQFRLPTGVAVSNDDKVYVAEQTNARVQTFTGNGSFLNLWTSGFATPLGVAVNAAGDVYVCEADNHRVQKFAANGTYLLQFGFQGSGNGQFQRPWAVAV